ncbi:toprim domain-containing protein [Patescibacteria group bacterium]|uniref:Putative DNA topoisomerase-primase n=1 Tax=viral metagenome TaxID=1070528 RepID=A0A6M3M7M9_9ZZZZ|nr:toprim domain-containing protein [Patescibacteria group bacterium]
MTFDELGIETKGKSGRYYTTCPFCSDDRKKKGVPCLTVNDVVGNRWYHCNHCGAKGNIDYIEKYKEVMKVSRMPSNLGQRKTYSIKVKNFLSSRGLDVKTALKRDIYELSGKDSSTILCYPFYIGQTLVNVKYRNLDWNEDSKTPKFWQISKEKGSKCCFMGLDSLSINMMDGDMRSKPNEVLIVEGENDWLTWKQLGYDNVLSVPQGAPNPDSKNLDKEFEYINDDYFQSIAKYIDIFYLITDGDGPGIFLRDYLARLLGKDRCFVVGYPDGYKDTNEVYAGNIKKKLKALGMQGVVALYESATPFPIKGIIKPSDVYNDLEKIRADGFRPGMSINVKEIDRLFTVKAPYMYVVCGVRGLGKSCFVRWYNVSLIRNNPDENINIGVYSPEMRPPAREFAKIIEVAIGKNIKKDDRNAMSDEQFSKAKRFVEKHFPLIAPDPKNFEDFNGRIKSADVNTLDSIFKYLIYLVKSHNIKGYVIDPWNTIEHQRKSSEQIDEYLAKCLEKILAFNHQYDLFCLIVGHPTNKVKRFDSGNFEKAGLHLMSGGAMWGNKADVGIIIHRSPWVTSGKMDTEGNAIYKYDKTAPTYIITDKVKFEELGSYGYAEMFMDMKQGGNFIPYNPKETKPVEQEKLKFNYTEEEDDEEIGVEEEVPF